MNESDQTARSDAVAGQKKPGQGRRPGIGRWNMSTTTIPTAITAWQQQEIRGEQLLRHLVSYDAWRVPVSEFAAAEMLSAHTAPRILTSRDPQGRTRLLLFSEAAAWETFMQASEGGGRAGQHFLTAAGSWIFGLPADPVDFLEIDPGSPWRISYGKEHFPRLRALAAAVDIERTLLALRRGDAAAGAAAQVRDYAGYLLAVVNRGGQTGLALAPDSKNRTLAAIFTAADNFDAFIETRQSSLSEGQLLSLELTGVELFRLLAGMRLDGLVFNCSGPAAAVAFAHAFAEVILQA